MSRKTKITALPALPPNVDPQLKPILHAIKEALEVQVGHRGEQLDKAVTFRDLTESGMADFQFDNNTGGHLLPVTNPGDLSTPPVPHSLAANGTFTNVLLSWQGGFRHPLVAATEVFRNTTDDLLTASFIGGTPAHIYVDVVEPGTTHYYWVRFRSPSGVLSPFNGTAGTSATTNLKISDILDGLNDSIGQTHLSTALSTEIDAIAINGNSISAEVSDRIAAISGEAASRATAVAGEAAARINAISALAASVADITGAEAYDSTATYATNDLVTYDSKLYKAAQNSSGNVPTNTTYWTLVGNYSSIGSVVVANASAVSDLDTRVTSAEGVNTSQATSITSLNSSVTNTNTNVATNTSAISGLDTRVTSAEGVNTSQSSDITALETNLTATDGNVTANASGLSSLATTVTTQGAAITTSAGDITALETALTATDGNVTANASGLSNLTTTVTTQGAAITTSAGDITALETALTSTDADVASNASGLSNLTTTVTSQGNAITASAGDITALETALTATDGNVTANASGLSNLTTTVTTQGAAITAQASDITTLNTTVGSNSASIQNHTGTINGLSAENYVKVDVNGHVAGYGIYGSSTYSEFAVNAGVFKISDGSSSVQPFSVITGAGLTVALSGTQYTNTTQAWQQANHPAGRWFAPGTYMDTAMIADASIEAAKIHNLTVDFANVTGTLTASQVSAITVTGSMIAASQTIVSPTIYGGTITAGTSLTSPVINGGTITGALVLSGSTGLITEAGGSHYGYNTAVTMDVTTTSTAATTQAQGNIKPYNYQNTAPPSPALKSPASNLWRYRRQNVSPDLSGSVYITNVGGLINSNGNSTQTHCTVTIKLREKVSGTVRSTKTFNINSFNSGDDATKTLTLTGSNGGYSYTLIHQYRTETGSDGHTTYYYHRMVPHTMTFTATPTGTVAFNDSTSAGMVAEVVISNIATAYASVGNRTIRIQDTAVNDY